MCSRRRYRGDSLILETEWDTPDGTVRVIDAMPPRGEAADVVRVVEGMSGRVPMRTAVRLRFDYGSVVPWVRHRDGQVSAIAGPDAAWLSSPVPLRGRDMATVAEFTVSPGERVPFVLAYRPSHQPEPRPVDAEQALADTTVYWSDWMGRFCYDGQWADAVRRSMVVLKALTYAPTGGILAAATTSLPEQWRGARNWDYRFCWLRDATFTLQALLGTGFVAEARAWREWLLRAVAGDPTKLQIMYGVDGSRRLPEYTVDSLSGYQGAAPVRVGNAAAEQFQLDVWGEVLDGLHLSRQAGISAGDDAWDLQRALLDFLEGHWDPPDDGLWEVRGERRPFVHSKVMAWAGVDRGVQAVEQFGLDGPLDRWLQRELYRDGFVLRYDPQADGGVDGLPGREGAFLACTFWLADALHGIGRHREGVWMFERLLGLRTDLGLLSEEYDPATGRQLGNTPQAYSHVALVNTARHLSIGRKEGRARTDCHPREGELPRRHRPPRRPRRGR
jgi:GH15 family glucan-1,4-alpha-glucosidase